MKRTLLLFLLGTFVFASGCSSNRSVRSPEFYPNEKYTQAGAAQANNDTRYCMSLADEYVQEPEHWKGVLEDTAKASVAGAAAGAVGGSIVSNAGRGTAIGAASGAIIALLNGLYKSGDPNPTYERFVEQCLAEKGYKVFGWS